MTGNSSNGAIGFAVPPSNPLDLLRKWVENAESLNVSEPLDLVLSTVDRENRPSSRVVLITEVDKTGIIFATSLLSKKGKDLQHNPYAAGNLWWRETIQQIKFEGKVSFLSDERSDHFFQKRKREG